MLPLRVACGETKTACHRATTKKVCPNVNNARINVTAPRGVEEIEQRPFHYITVSISTREAGNGSRKPYQGILRSFCARARVSSL